MRVSATAAAMFAASSAAFLLAGAAAASTIIGTPFSAREFLTNEDPNVNVQASVGTGGFNADAGLSGLLLFELPVLSSAPTFAQLTTTLSEARDLGSLSQVPSTFNVDLYFLGLRSSVTISEPADYIELGTIPAGASLIQADWWVMNDDSQIGTSQSISVLSQIQSSYSGGTPNDNVAVFGLGGDINFGNNTFTWLC